MLAVAASVSPWTYIALVGLILIFVLVLVLVLVLVALVLARGKPGVQVVVEFLSVRIEIRSANDDATSAATPTSVVANRPPVQINPSSDSHPWRRLTTRPADSKRAKRA
jgi:hypothetical protein